MTPVALFDLGGVIVDLTGLAEFLERHRLQPKTFWPAWLALGVGNDFESGRTTADEFADAFLAQFRLELTPSEFLTEFAAWPTGLLPGAGELLADLRTLGVVTATLSNTNPIHWNSAFQRDDVTPMFDRHFPSFHLGLAKPDEAIFVRAAEPLDVDVADVSFLDDNLVNVHAAERVGMHAFHVRGPNEARAALLGT